jgi:UDP-galactose transporter B1
VVIKTVAQFNSLVLATVTTTRKFFTVLTSVMWFGHHITLQQWLGVAAVFAGLALEIVNKFLSGGKKKHVHHGHGHRKVDHEHAAGAAKPAGDKAD